MGVLGDLCRFVPGCRSRRHPHRRDWDDDERGEEATASV
jgi:hypothetical protein